MSVHCKPHFHIFLHFHKSMLRKCHCGYTKECYSLLKTTAGPSGRLLPFSMQKPQDQQNVLHSGTPHTSMRSTGTRLLLCNKRNGTLMVVFSLHTTSPLMVHSNQDKFILSPLIRNSLFLTQDKSCFTFRTEGEFEFWFSAF